MLLTSSVTKRWSYAACGSTALFYSEKLDVSLAVHGDDMLGEGEPDSLDNIDAVLDEKAEHKKVARIGPEASVSGKILNKQITWSEAGFTYEANPKHAARMVDEMKLAAARPVVTPGSAGLGKNVPDALDELDAYHK